MYNRISIGVNLAEALRRLEVSANRACSATSRAHCYATPTALHNGSCYHIMTAHPQPIVIQCHLYRTLSQLLPLHLSSCLPACLRKTWPMMDAAGSRGLSSVRAMQCVAMAHHGDHTAAVGHNYMGCAKKKPKFGAWMILPVRNASSTVGQSSMISSFPFAEYTLMF